MIHARSELILDHIAEEMADIIREHYGCEVFFIGWVDREGIVCEFEAIAFGNDESVPAPLAESLRGDVVIHNHPSGDLRASNADINIASILAVKKLGFYIIDNDCENINIVYKPKPRYFVPEKSAVSIFQKDGLLEQTLGFYEERPEQELLVQNIIDAINNDMVLIAEAGTGTGKSLSYLIPAALWAVESDKRVLVTTATINLQNQIAKKDLELVSSIIERFSGKTVRSAVLVGRSNYLCPKMLDELISDHDKSHSLFEDDQRLYNQLEAIRIWAENTEEGLRNEIPISISNELWEEISANTPACQRKECPFYTSCFYYKARMVAEAAHIIIGNHALLLASIDDENGFTNAIPHFSGLVLDEAHHLEDITLRAMAQEFSFRAIEWRLSRLYRTKKDKDFGQLSLLRDRSTLDRFPVLSELFHKVCSDVLQLSSHIRYYEEQVREILNNQESSSIELEKFILQKPEWVHTKKILQQVFDQIRLIESGLSRLSENVRSEINDDRVLDILKIIDTHTTGLESLRQAFDNIFNSTDDSTLSVKQAQISPKIIKFSTGPAEVGDFLAKHLFRPKEFTIFASATLSVDNSFEYFSSGIGLNFLDDKKYHSISLPSPFDYRKQMEICIYKGPEDVKLTPEKISLIRDSVLMVGGGALLLFTSYSAMDYVYNQLADEFAEAGLHPMKQGDLSREILLETMRTKDYTVLFATASFWEGIDVQGDNLRFLVIDKLPFDSPTDPLVKAKSRIMETQKKNVFMEFSVPRAVLRYKQGIGRLIRSKNDRGILLVLDSRIFSKRYGQSFINAAKPSVSYHLTPQDILRRIGSFFGITRKI